MRIARWCELVLAAGSIVVWTGGAWAQGPSVPVEIGTQPFGIVRVSQFSSSHTFLAIPGGELESSPTLYAAIFASPRLAVEPAAFYLHRSGGGWSGAGLLRLGGYFSGEAQDSPFLFGEVGVLGSGNGDVSDSEAGFGAGGGYRWLVADRRVALRLEGRIRRWQTDPHTTEVGLVLAVGIVAGRGR